MERNKIKFWGSLILAFILGWAISQFYHTKSIHIEDRSLSQEHNTEKTVSSSESKTDNTDVPPYALETLEYVLEHGESPSGYVGGRIFQNREGLLPKQNTSGKKIIYREWDVHPKAQGQNRGAERLVTSEDGAAYFTDNHYQSFIKIK